VGHDLSGKQVKDRADIEVVAIYFETGDVADPDAVRCVCFELSLQEVLLFQ